MSTKDEDPRQEPLSGLEGLEGMSPQPRLPMETREPIPYALTARGRHAVTPTAPALRVVSGDGADPREDDLDDPRSVQARALRRAGMPVPAIAQRLAVDAFTVRAWLGGRAAPRPQPVVDPDGASGTAALDPAVLDEIEERSTSDPGFSAGVATLGAVADVDGAAVILVSDRPAPLAQALAFLHEEFSLTTSQLRVVLRLGALVAGDRAVNDWSNALGIPSDRFRQVRSGRVPTPDGIEVLVRVNGANVATAVGAWLRHHQRSWQPTGRLLTDAPAG